MHVYVCAFDVYVHMHKHIHAHIYTHACEHKHTVTVTLMQIFMLASTHIIVLL